MDQDTPPIARTSIERAETLIRPHIRRTPVMEVMGDDFGLPVDRLLLKLELLQHSGSFKPRGAFTNLLTRGVPAAGVVAASGGNHGGVPQPVRLPETCTGHAAGRGVGARPGPREVRRRGRQVGRCRDGARRRSARGAGEDRVWAPGGLVWAWLTRLSLKKRLRPNACWR